MTDHSDRSIVAERLARYFSDVKAVDGIDLSIPSGSIFGFLGPNGSGKSTTVKVLATILAPTTGSVRVAGLDITRQQQEVRARIGVALQEVGLDPLMTSREMLVLQGRLFQMPASEAKATAERLLRAVGLDEVDPRKRVGQYSGGMKRRLDLALALVNDPEILFLDEPTTGLDPSSRLAIWEEVRRLNKDLGMTIFLTTQYLEEADRLADEVAIIDRGRVVAQGPPQELKKQIGNDSVSLTFASPEVARQADVVLASLCPDRQVSGRELLCYFAAAADRLPGLVRALDEAGIQLDGLTLSQPTLDDVFLRATGQRMAQKAETAPAAEKNEP